MTDAIRDAGTDVVIVGGGPAGGAAAILLARFGYSCVLIERRLLGAPRLCGEFLSPDSLPTLRTLSVEDEIGGLKPPLIETVRVVANHRISWEGRLPRHGLGITRRSLEEMLLSRAESLGVRLMLGAVVRQFSTDSHDGWLVEVDPQDGPRRRIRARSVVRSSGREGLRPTQDQPGDRYVAYQAHFNGPSLEGRVELHGFLGGYLGLIDVEKGMRNLCLLARPSVDPNGRSSTSIGASGQTSPNRPESFLSRVARSRPPFAAWLSGATRVSDWTSASVIGVCRESPVSADGIFALGDAAGVIAPFSGDGRSMALRSAEIMAPILHEHLSGRISLNRARSIWTRAWRQEFRARTRAARILNRILIHPATLAATLRIFRTLPFLGEFAISSTRGRHPGIAEDSL